MYIRLDTITGIYRQTDLIGKTISQFACIGESPEYITFEGRTSGGGTNLHAPCLSVSISISLSLGVYLQVFVHTNTWIIPRQRGI